MRTIKARPHYFEGVDDHTFNLTICPSQRIVTIGFSGVVAFESDTQAVCFDIDMNGQSISNGDGVHIVTPGNDSLFVHVSFVHMVTDLVAYKPNTFVLKWAVNEGGVRLAATDDMLHVESDPQFWVREVS